MKVTFELYAGKDKTRVRATHKNSNKLFNAGQGYSRRIDAATMLNRFIEAIKSGDYEIVDKRKGGNRAKR